jgi:ABC-2 type transport system permease protein
VSYNLREFLTSFAQNAEGINAILVKFYYPVLQYINLVLSFNFLDLIVFIVANFGILLLTVLILGRVYYAINSRVKVIKTDVKKREYSIRTSRLTVALVKKEIGRFASSPVFVINAGFGLVLYALVCILLCLNMEGWLGQISEVGIEGLSAEKIMNFLPAIVFGLIFVTSMMTSITSSMISLEGKSFNVLKSLPVSAMRIILGKIYAAMVVMVPIILVGDIALFIRFDFSIWQMLMILVASIVMPMIAELVGIIVNLKFPKMDAEDDVEVVKQSMSSMIAVFIGMGAAAIMVALLYGVFMIGMSASDIMIIGTVVCLVILGLLLLYLKKRGEKEFNAINV